MKISILLPYKENFTHDLAGAVSLFVSQITERSKYKSNINIYGNTNSNKYLTSSYKNLYFKKNIFLSSSKSYVNNFLKIKNILTSDIIEVHNRPNYIKHIKKKFNNKIFLFFHNYPLYMDGSTSINDRIYLINNVNKLIFNSNWSKQRFFLDVPKQIIDINKISVCYQSSDDVKINFAKKEKIISFIGKLNSAKGYDIFGNAVIEVLKKNKDWSAVVIGDEAREKLEFHHDRLKILGFKDNKFILNLLKKISISVVCSRWEEPFGRVSLEAASRGCAIVTSSTGGLPETSKYSLKLNNLDVSALKNVLNKLIKNKLYLLRKQKENYKGFFLTHKYVASLVDNIRTNQFNISHKPISSENIKSLIKDKERVFYEVSMSDKFGDYGVIAIIGIKEENGKFKITDFLESCRVFKRNVEDYLIRFVKGLKRFKNKEGLILINRNKKNIYVQNLFDNSNYLKKIDNKTYKIIKNHKFNELRNMKVKIN